MKTRIKDIDFKKSYQNLIIDHIGLDLDFFIFIICATIICHLGFFLNSASVIIGAMVLSPILYPIIILSTSLIQKDKINFKKSFSMILVGSIIIILISFLLNFVFPVNFSDSEIYLRIEGNILSYFLIAFISGLAGTFCFFWPKALEAITGIAISIALLPPLVLLGSSLLQPLYFIEKSILITIINFIGLILGSGIIIYIIKKLVKQ